MQVADRGFVVTGGAQGLGAATARLLAEAGARVLVVDLREGPAGASPGFFRADITDEAAARAAFDAFAERFGPLHGLVNCAGIAPAEKLLGRQGPHALDSFVRTLQVNLVGTFNMARLAAERMASVDADEGGERGVIVNTASVAAYDGQVGQAAYAASKGGVVAMTLPLARELARHGVRVCTIAPGIMATPMMEAMPAEVQASLGAAVPFPPRLGRPEEFAALVRHVIENRYLNGEVIRLDGAIRMAPR